MGIFRSIGFTDEDLDEFIKSLNGKGIYQYPNGSATFRGKTFNYVLFNDTLELWSQCFPKDDNCKYTYFSMTDGVMRTAENFEEDVSVVSSSHQIFKFNLCGVSYPIFAEFPKGCVPEIKNDERYRITVAASASYVWLYSSLEEFRRDSGDVDVRSVAPAIVYSPDTDPITMADININGYVKAFELLTNPFSGKKYYKITISSFQLDYVVYADERDVDEDIAVNDIISVCARLFARFEFEPSLSRYLGWTCNDGYTKFSTAITPVIATLSPANGDFLVLTLDRDATVDDIEFIQTTLEDEEMYLVEIKKVVDGIKYLYRKSRLNWTETLNIFYDLCINRKAPDLCEWEDVSDEIFADRRVKPGDYDDT